MLLTLPVLFDARTTLKSNTATSNPSFMRQCYLLQHILVLNSMSVVVAVVVVHVCTVLVFKMYILLVRFKEGGGGFRKEYPLYTCENGDNYG